MSPLPLLLLQRECGWGAVAGEERKRDRPGGPCRDIFLQSATNILPRPAQGLFPTSPPLWRVGNAQSREGQGAGNILPIPLSLWLIFAFLRPPFPQLDFLFLYHSQTFFFFSLHPIPCRSNPCPSFSISFLFSTCFLCSPPRNCWIFLSLLALCS